MLTMLNKNQKEEIKNGLLQLEFTKKEVTVYLSILQSIDTSVPSLAKNTELSRGTIYDIIEKLKKKGFITEIKKSKKRRIIAENPTNRLYSFLDKKHKQLETAKKIVENILPSLKAINANEDYKPQIRVYEGKGGFQQVWDEVFSYEGKNWLSIARIETFQKFMGQEFLDEIQKRKAKLGFTSRAINEDSSLSQTMRFNDQKYSRETRFTPKEFQFPSSEIIFGDKIAMFSTLEENIILVIKSKDFAETHKAYFEMLWKFLEK
ncbi:helix-turn-helix domain-containing protein [Patescibacteria group bacterium]|nr:helix-turn-helix domain-containing protein [Patescibacteria group bacterium]MBU0880365.1 helix-turn-helix domain-containing protein [Patescibacteria group bacterium]MBU1783001.1 helix-turn-helix domain-containing protein [Patescibacteria group bacterium]MBU1991508.1 helix-turn-helix domain-containing protein [Patescibacteria group bacterium]